MKGLKVFLHQGSQKTCFFVGEWSNQIFVMGNSRMIKLLVETGLKDQFCIDKLLIKEEIVDQFEENNRLIS